jgi:hypothetical protein
MANQTELKWYQKPAGVIILLIISFPVGLYLMWKNELWSKQTRWIITVVIAIVVIANVGNNNSNRGSNQSAEVESREGTKTCLVGFDWVYPSSSNPTNAWKFSSDGTFNSSTTMFGGMSTWGNWEIISPGKISISYTRTSERTIPDNQILTMSSCSSLKVGSTIYSKD